MDLLSRYWPIWAAKPLLCVLLLLLGSFHAYAEDTIHGEVQYHYQDPPISNIQGQVNQDNEPGVIGLEFSLKKALNAKVKDVYPGTPAFYAGIQPGDEILTVDGKSTKGLTVAQMDKAVSDRPGDLVEFMISRQGKLSMKTVVVMPVSSLMSAQLRNKYATAIFASNMYQIEDMTDY